MINKKTLPLFLILAFFISSCSGTALVSSWKTEAQPKQYSKVGVLVLTSSKVARSVMERAMVQDFKDKGINATTTMAIFPSVKADGLVVNRSEEETKAFMQTKLDEAGIDAIIVLVMKKREKKEGYGQRANSTRYFGNYNSYYGYMGYNITQISTPGYYGSSTKYFVESNLYDIESSEMIYSAQTKTKDPSNVKKEVEHLVSLVVNDIVKKKAISTK